jgi:hypothetical protein
MIIVKRHNDLADNKLLDNLVGLLIGGLMFVVILINHLPKSSVLAHIYDFTSFFVHKDDEEMDNILTPFYNRILGLKIVLGLVICVSSLALVITHQVL